MMKIRSLEIVVAINKLRKTMKAGQVSCFHRGRVPSQEYYKCTSHIDLTDSEYDLETILPSLTLYI